MKASGNNVSTVKANAVLDVSSTPYRSCERSSYLGNSAVVSMDGLLVFKNAKNDLLS